MTWFEYLFRIIKRFRNPVLSLLMAPVFLVSLLLVFSPLNSAYAVDAHDLLRYSARAEQETYSELLKLAKQQPERQTYYTRLAQNLESSPVKKKVVNSPTIGLNLPASV